MWDYIVLGQVPGTSIQVSFETWLLIVAGLAGTVVIYHAVRWLLRSQLLAAIRIGLVMQHAAYAGWLLSRQHLRV